MLCLLPHHRINKVNAGARHLPHYCCALIVVYGCAAMKHTTAYSWRTNCIRIKYNYITKYQLRHLLKEAFLMGQQDIYCWLLGPAKIICRRCISFSFSYNHGCNRSLACPKDQPNLYYLSTCHQKIFVERMYHLFVTLRYNNPFEPKCRLASYLLLSQSATQTDRQTDKLTNRQADK